jgi:hypothetical protein
VRDAEERHLNIGGAKLRATLLPPFQELGDDRIDVIHHRAPVTAA